MRHRPLRALALAGMTALAAITAQPAAVASPAAPRALPATFSDGVMFWPTTSSTAVVVRNGVKTTRTVGPTAWALNGHFSSATGSDAFLYNPGSAADQIVHAATTGVGGYTLSSSAKTVNGSFRPLVGDFNGDGTSDILWYAKGPAADSLWLFNAAGGHTSKALTINGDYRPTVLDAGGSGADDIIWHGPGTKPDSIWRFDDAGNHVIQSITLNGSYLSVLGTFGDFDSGDRWPQVVWFNPAGPDYAWVFRDDGSYRSWALPNIDGDYLAIPGTFDNTGRSSILWYRPGTATERYWTFDTFGQVSQPAAPTVNGTYVPAVADLDGNFYQDIVWSGAGSATVWSFTAGVRTQSTISGLPADALPLALDNREAP